MENKSSNGWKFFALLFGALLAAVVGLYIYKQQNPDYDPWEEPWENSSSPVDLRIHVGCGPFLCPAPSLCPILENRTTMTPHMLSSCPILQNRTTVCTRWGTVHRFFSSRYVSATHAYASRGPNIDSQRFTACTAGPVSNRKALALTSTVIHPRIYPLDGAR